MNFPSIFDWLERAEPLRGFPAAYIVIIAAAIVVLVWEWRVNLLALLVFYLSAGLLFVDVLDPRLAYIKVIVGLFICLMLYFTARQVNWGSLPPDLSPTEAEQLRGRPQMVQIGRFHFPLSGLLRVVLVLVVALVVLNVGTRPSMELPAVPTHVNLAIWGLLALGLLGLGSTTEPLKAGMGLLIFLTGFELLYNTLEQSAAVLATLAAANLIITLAVAYLTQARHTLPISLDDA